jgi:hypothetical protein
MVTNSSTGKTVANSRNQPANAKCAFRIEKRTNAFNLTTGEPQPVGLTPAVLREVKNLFPVESRQEVIELPDKKCGRTIPFRREASAEELKGVRLCVLKNCKSDLAPLQQWILSANIDERDLPH